MGKHRAPRMRAGDLRRAYPRLLNAYGRLLEDYRRLEDRTVRGPSAEVELWQPPPPARPAVWGHRDEAMDVEAACELVRETGLLLSPGFGT